MKIKQKIQQQAIQLFNEKGIASVSMKQIADALEISAGNLQYHYKSKSDLMAAIYKAMHEESAPYVLPKGEYITLHHFQKIILSYYDYQCRYAFYFSDLTYIARAYPAVKALHEKSNIQRFKECQQLVGYFIETGRMLPERNGFSYDHLIHSIWMGSIFWIAQSQIMDNRAYPINRASPMGNLWNLILPHLTKKGLEEYQQIKQFVKISG